MKYFLLTFLLLLLYGCGSVKSMNNCEVISKAIASEKFRDFFKEEIKTSDTLVVYDGTGNFINCMLPDVLNAKIVKLDFEVKIGESRVITDPKIVLHKFHALRERYILYFFYTEINATLELHYNNKGELVDFKQGVF